MKCKNCKNEMEFIHCDDNPSKIYDGGLYAHNLYYCIECMIYCKQNVWDYKSEVWILANNMVINV